MHLFVRLCTGVHVYVLAVHAYELVCIACVCVRTCFAMQGGHHLLR